MRIEGCIAAAHIQPWAWVFGVNSSSHNSGCDGDATCLRSDLPRRRFVCRKFMSKSSRNDTYKEIRETGLGRGRS